MGGVGLTMSQLSSLEECVDFWLKNRLPGSERFSDLERSLLALLKVWEELWEIKEQVLYFFGSWKVKSELEARITDFNVTWEKLGTKKRKQLSKDELGDEFADCLSVLIRFLKIKNRGGWKLPLNEIGFEWTDLSIENQLDMIDLDFTELNKQVTQAEALKWNDEKLREKQISIENMEKYAFEIFKKIVCLAYSCDVNIEESINKNIQKQKSRINSYKK